MFRRSFVVLISAALGFVSSGSIVMADENVQLKEVVVTATKTEKQSQDVTQSVTVITADEIKKSGAVTVSEVIQTKVGLTTNNTGPLGGLNTVRIRGSSYQQVLVLLDGARMNSLRDGGFDLSALPVPLDAIERIEIVRGPASALYGADAVGGVVNIITKKPKGPSTIIGQSAGAHGYSDLVLNNMGKQENVYYSINAEKERSVGYRLNGDLDKKSAGIKVGYSFDTSSSIEVTEDYLTKDIGVPGQTTFSTPNARQFNRDILTGIVYKARLSKEVDFKINAFEQRDTMHFKDPDSFPPTYSTHKTTGRSADMQINVMAGSWNLISLGAEARRDHLESTDAGDHAASLEAEYIQDEISLGDSLILVIGGRNDKHSLYGSQWSPKASARYLFSGTGTILRASYGKSFRAPTFNDLFWPYSSSIFSGPTSTTIFVTQGNSSLAPERAEEFEGGIEQPFGNGNMVRLTGFRRKVKNLIQWQEILSFPTASTTIDQFNPVNIGRARISGYEAEVKFVLSEAFVWSLNYMRLFPVDELTGERIFSSAAPIPDMQFGSSLRLALDNQTVLALDGRRVKNYVEPGAEKWDYYTVDGKITETIGSKDAKIDVFLGMRNMFNRKYETAKGYPMPPQELYGGATAQF